jgi:hypothetical protein
MRYPPRVILHVPPRDSPKLAAFVENCIQDKVALVCVVGNDCKRVEIVIDGLIVGDGSDTARFFNTTSHPNESIAEVRKFAEFFSVDDDQTSPVLEVWL